MRVIPYGSGKVPDTPVELGGWVGTEEALRTSLMESPEECIILVLAQAHEESALRAAQAKAPPVMVIRFTGRRFVRVLPIGGYRTYTFTA